MKKVLIISTTLRKNGNSEILANEFARGAIDGGNDVEEMSLQGKKIDYCIGCLSCQKTKKCVIKDDVSSIIAKMLKSDVIVFSTPIYFYEMAGQMKTLLDRTNPLFSSNYQFKDIYLIGTAADSSKSSLNGAMNGLQGWVDCFENSHIAGVIYGTGLTNAGEALRDKEVLKLAFDMGKNL